MSKDLIGQSLARHEDSTRGRRFWRIGVEKLGYECWCHSTLVAVDGDVKSSS